MKHSIRALMIMLSVAACGATVDNDPGAGADDGSDPRQGGANRCPEPDGPRHDYTTSEELTGLITGKWIHCTGDTPFPLDGSVGVEFTADGKYHTLVKGTGGAIVRGAGLASEGVWKVKEGWLQLWVTPSVLYNDTPLFEDSPRRVALATSFDGDFAVYQSIP